MGSRTAPSAVSRFAAGFPLWTIPAILAIAVLILGLVDPNDHLLAANDVYHLRQKARYADIFVWRADELTFAGILDKVARFLFWCMYYFHGMLPQVYFALPTAMGEYLGIDRPILLSQSLVTGYAAVSVVLFHYSLRAGGVSRGAAFFGALLLGFSPLLTGISRGVGTEWIVNACFSQTLLIAAALHLERRRGPLLMGIAIAHALLSDPISFLSIGAVGTAWLLESWFAGGRETLARRLTLMRPWTFWLPPLLAASAVILWNILRWRYRDLIPGEATLFFYPFSKYLGDAVAAGGPHFGPDSWLEMSIVSFGVWAPVVLPAVVIGSLLFRRSLAPTFLTFWSAIASAGFGILFYLLNGPSSGSAGMPIYGYPAYTLVPFLAFAVVHCDRLIRAYRIPRTAALAGAILLAGFSLTSTISYIWRLPFPPGSTLLADPATDYSLDNIGIKRPQNGDRAAGYISRKMLVAVLMERNAEPVTLLRYSRSGDRGFDPFWVYSGLDGGGTWFQHRIGIKPEGRIIKAVAGAADAQNGVQAELFDSDLDLGNMVDAKVRFEKDPCPFPVCLVVGKGRVDPTAVDTAMFGAPALVITGSGQPLYGIFTVGDVSPPLRGTFEASELDAAFRKEFPSLFDMLPQPISGAFLKRICEALGCRIGL